MRKEGRKGGFEAAGRELEDGNAHGWRRPTIASRESETLPLPFFECSAISKLPPIVFIKVAAAALHTRPCKRGSQANQLVEDQQQRAELKTGVDWGCEW